MQKKTLPPLTFEDDRTKEEHGKAAIKVQSHVRRQQTQKDFNNKKDQMKYEKDRDALVKKARRAEALETEVKRLRDKLIESTLELDSATDRGRTEARLEYEKELARRERQNNGKGGGGGINQQMFEATAQELDMAQTKLAQTRSDLEQERKRNMRLHRLRMAAEEEIENAKETLNILSTEGERERNRCSEYEKTIDDLKDELRDANESIAQMEDNGGQQMVIMGPNGVSREYLFYFLLL
jgi:chromosome segregation ATPase